MKQIYYLECVSRGGTLKSDKIAFNTLSSLFSYIKRNGFTFSSYIITMEFGYVKD